MKVLFTHNANVTAEFTTTEFLILKNALELILKGMDSLEDNDQFYPKIGGTYAEAAKLSQQIPKIIKS